MINQYQGPFKYNKQIIQDWNNTAGGVYYCGVLNQNGSLGVCYVGKAFGDGGIRSRLLQHINENKWHDVTHFGYAICSNENESIDFESQEIRRLNPKYNTQGKIW